ncbi:MAG: M16 family metallopeptidase [Polyangiaceae bacterium]
MKRALGVLCVLLGGCTPGASVSPGRAAMAVPPPVVLEPAPPPSAAPKVDETFRQTPPPEANVGSYAPPPVEKGQLKNGIPVFVVPRTGTLCSIQVVATLEAGDLAPSQAETAIVLTRLMIDGTTLHDMYSLRGSYESIWMREPEIHVTPDALTVSASAPADQLARAIELVGELTLKPAFPEKAFARSREQVATARSHETSEPGPIANLGMRKLLFGKDPYGSPFGSAKQARAVTRAEVGALHARVFAASRLSILVATDVPSKDVLAKLEDAFGSLKTTPPKDRAPVAIPAVEAPRLLVIDTPGKSFAFIEQGFAVPPVGDPDIQAVRVAHGILADPGLGRLEHRLRDELAEVPWLNHEWHLLRRAGFVGWTTQAPAAKAGQTLAEVDRMVRALATEGPTADEFATVLNRQNSGALFEYETAPDSARSYAAWLGSGLLPDDVARWTARRASLKIEDVKAAAARYLGGDRLRTVIVGDWKALKDPLTALGWGPIEVHDVDFTAGGDGRGDHAVR